MSFSIVIIAGGRARLVQDGVRQSLDNRTQSLEVDTRLSHSERDLWRPSREEAYLSHIWWRRSRGNIVILVPEGEQAYILVARSGVNFVH